jgi:SAM-dependent methyltransferase
MAAQNLDPEAEIARRAHVHAMWEAVAPAWGEHAAFVDARGAALTEALLELVAPAPGDRVLELAAGAGGVGLAAAARVGPEGVVVVSDIAATNVAFAAARARDRGLRNVQARAIDLEYIDEPDASFDVIVCRDGLQFAIDPARAVASIRRVLRTGGRLGLAVWAAPEANPWASVLFGAVRSRLGIDVPPPGVPGPFSLADAEQLGRLLREARFDHVVIDREPVPMRVPSFDEWWSRTTALAGPLAQLLAGLPPDTLDAMRADARAAVGPYETATGLEFPGLTWVASARAAS